MGDYFINHYGDMIALEDAEGMLKSILKGRTYTSDQVWRMLHGLFIECFHKELYAAARSYIEKMIPFANDPMNKVQTLYYGGQVCEKMKDYESAIIYYGETLALRPGRESLQYFANNNLGYSLNQVGGYKEAEAHCRAAIGITPLRPNAHKNLGLSLQGQDRYREAAEAFVAAIKADRMDTRALHHLRDLIRAHKELESEIGNWDDWIQKLLGTGPAVRRRVLQ